MNDLDFHGLIDNVPQLIWISDADGSTQFCNSKVEEHIGVVPKSFSPDGINEFIHPEDQRLCYWQWKEAFTQALPFEGEFRIRNVNDNTYHWYLVRAVPIKNKINEIEKWLGTGTIINEQKKVETNLRFLLEATRRLSSSLDYQTTLESLAKLTVPDMADICIIDLLERNGQIERLVFTVPDSKEATFKEEIERNVKDLRYSPALKAIEENRTICKSGFDYTRIDANIQEIPFIRMAKELNVHSFLVTPIRASGNPIGAMTLAYRGFERKYSDSDIPIAENLARFVGIAIENAQLYKQARNAAKLRDELVAIVSHDLKNPVSAVKLNADLIFRILEKGDKPPYDFCRKAIANIRCASNRMANLIRDLLDMAMIEAGRFRVNKAPENVWEIVSETMDMLKPLAKEKQIEISTLTSTDLQCHCDKEKMFQLFSNLVGNAIKFSNTGGKIWLRADKDPWQIKFSVKDNGPGINKDDLIHIFDRFYQGKKCKTAGAGLGLAISRAIVDSHGGHIWVESEAGRGSTFSFVIPLE